MPLLLLSTEFLSRPPLKLHATPEPPGQKARTTCEALMRRQTMRGSNFIIILEHHPWSPHATPLRQRPGDRRLPRGCSYYTLQSSNDDPTNASSQSARGLLLLHNAMETCRLQLHDDCDDNKEGKRRYMMCQYRRRVRVL